MKESFANIPGGQGIRVGDKAKSIFAVTGLSNLCAARDLLTHPTFYTCAHAVQCFLTLKRTNVYNSPPRMAVARRQRDDGRAAC
jgi:ribosomal protein S5